MLLVGIVDCRPASMMFKGAKSENGLARLAGLESCNSAPNFEFEILATEHYKQRKRRLIVRHGISRGCYLSA